MPTKKQGNNEPELIFPKKLSKARTDESREKQVINLAFDLAEKQLEEGTASSAVITHFLKMGSARNKEEIKNLKEQNKLLIAKVGQIASQKDNEQIAKDALAALKGYSGEDDAEQD